MSRTIKVVCPLCGEASNKPYRYETRRIAKVEIELGHNICKSCELQYVSPRPDNTALSLLYDKEYHTATVSGVYNVDSKVSRQEYVSFAKYLSEYLPNNASILDVGCGVGNLLHEIKQRADFKCLGVELSADAAKIAKQSGLDVINGSLNSANFSAGRFDAVTLLYVLEHVEDPVGILSEIKRVLKDGGYLFVAVPNYRYLHIVYESFLSRLFTDIRTLHPEEHLQNFTPGTLLKAVKKVGFTLVEQNCAKPLVIGSPLVRILKNISYYFVKVLSVCGYNIGGIHFVLKK